MRQRALAAAVVLALAWGAVALARDDDHRVDADRPEARRAAKAALAVVPGHVRQVARDVDTGKWEVTIVQDSGEYEVELHPQNFTLLRLDYD
jgi:hypothetical protein